MKSILDKISESKSAEINEQNLLAIMCSVKTLMNKNANYSLELKTNHINPTISESQAFDAAEILLSQKIWEIS